MVLRQPRVLSLAEAIAVEVVHVRSAAEGAGSEVQRAAQRAGRTVEHEQVTVGHDDDLGPAVERVRRSGAIV